MEGFFANPRIIALTVFTYFHAWTVVDGGCTVPRKFYRCPLRIFHPCRCTDSTVKGLPGIEVICRHEYTTCNQPGPKPFKSIPILPRDLVVLDLDRNAVNSIRSDDFKGCTSLRSLLLRKNLLATIAADAFSDLANLQHLHLHYNRLQLDDDNSLPSGVLDPLKSLIDLKVHCNIPGKLSKYRKDFFRNKTSLKSITLDSVNNARLPKPEHDIKLKTLSHIELYDILHELGHQFDNWDDVGIKYLGVYSACGSSQQLSEINTDVFNHLPHLEYLDISWNPKLSLMGKIMKALKALSGSKVHILSLKNNGNGSHDIDNLSTAFFNTLKAINLTELYLDGNGIVDLQPTNDLSSYLPHLEVFSMPYNRLFGNIVSVINRTKNMENLRVIDMDKQTRRLTHSDDLTEIRYIRKSSQNDAYINLPPKLREIHLSDAIDFMVATLTKIIINEGPQNISLIDLSRNKFQVLKGPLIFHNPLYSSHQIERLNLSDCSISYICKTLFPSDGNLTIISLDLSKNIELGQFFIGDNKGEIMGNLNHTGIQVLNISMTFTKYLHRNFFKYLKTIRELILSNNALVYWPDSINQLHKLVNLDLSFNKFLQLPSCSTAFLRECAQQNGGLRLDISNNPLLVSCRSLSFLLWILHYPSTITLVNEDRITFEKGTISELPDMIHFVEINCRSEIWAKVAGGMCALMFLATYIAVMVHRNRWTIKFFFVELSRRRKGYESQTNEEDFEYDAFVAYHKDSLTWLVQEMVEHLEGRLTVEPLRLCLHHRDWLPGIPIEENVLSSIKKSRRTVILLTRSFLRSNWCDFEFQMARIHGFDEGQDILVIVQLDDVRDTEMNRTLLNLRKTHTWLERPDPENAEAVGAFWERLRKALKSSSRKPTDCICGHSCKDED
ncbi:hypothetical protein LSH36_852g00007 [Paralvinella palmiformis]|uniref:TIR domain-containing protein n=1 Tax=Paralvinella palmiformis TaxID=53620 RepID=A0AAD9J0F8_9ANNE|nr:hypothetical protein LSH36_852g00007 [Paralvinella palmiformis]